MSDAKAIERALLVETATSVLRHDLRNKVGSVRNAAHYLRTRARKAPSMSEDPRVERFFELIDGELAAMIDLVMEGTQPSLPIERDVRAQDLADVVRTAARETAEARPDVHLRLDLDASIRVEADEGELRALVEALVRNGLEAMPSGGELRVRTERDGDMAALVVEDEGAGFPSIDALRPLTTTKPGHVGLGLAVVQRVVSRIDGFVDLPPAGTEGRVTVRIPVAEGTDDVG